MHGQACIFITSLSRPDICLGSHNFGNRTDAFWNRNQIVRGLGLIESRGANLGSRSQQTVSQIFGWWISNLLHLQPRYVLLMFAPAVRWVPGVSGMFIFCCWQRTGVEELLVYFTGWFRSRFGAYLVFKDVLRRAIRNSSQEHRIITNCGFTFKLRVLCPEEASTIWCCNLYLCSGVF